MKEILKARRESNKPNSISYQNDSVLRKNKSSRTVCSTQKVSHYNKLDFNPVDFPAEKRSQRNKMDEER